MNESIDKPASSGVHQTMRARCLALGLPVWRCDGDGRIIDEPDAPDMQLPWFSSPRLRKHIENATLSFAQRIAGGSAEVFPGCWLVALLEKQGTHCDGMTVVMMLETASLQTTEFQEICRAAAMSPDEVRNAAKPMLRADRAAVEQSAAVLSWTHEDLVQRDRDRSTLNQFGNKLAQAYEETNMLFRLARMTNIVSSPEELMELVCKQLQQVLPFQWTALGFKKTDLEVPNLAGRLIVEGDLPCPRASFNELLRDVVESQTSDDWTRLLTPPTSSLAALVDSQVIADPITHDDHVIGVLLAGNKQDEDSDVSSAEIQVIEACADFLGVFHENLSRFSAQRDLFMAMVQALTASIDAKDPYTCGHSERVALLATQIATGLNMDRGQIEQVQVAGLLHDVGKIGIPEAVLFKPARLTVAEFELIKRHPQIGHDILKDIPMLGPMLPGVLHHHERWDGKGYPGQLSREGIPLFGRILAVADAFDSMSSNRSYRAALPRARSLQEIRDCSGTQFDPKLAAVFLTLDLSRFDEMLARHESRARQAA